MEVCKQCEGTGLIDLLPGRSEIALQCEDCNGKGGMGDNFKKVNKKGVQFVYKNCSFLYPHEEQYPCFSKGITYEEWTEGKKAMTVYFPGSYVVFGPGQAKDCKESLYERHCH